jgi:hypothetical protein
MNVKKRPARLAGVAAAIAFGSTLLVGAATPAQAVPAVYYQVINGNSANSCLQVVDVPTGKGNLVLGNCDRSAKQVWTIVNGVWTNPASGHCLDGNGADVYTYPCNYGPYQHYTTTSGSPKYIRHSQSLKYLHANGIVGSHVVYAPTTGTSSRWVIDQVG